MFMTSAAIATLAKFLIGAAIGAGVATGTEQGISNSNTRSRQNQMKKYLREQHPELSSTDIDALVAQYGDVGGGLWDVAHWFDQSDWNGLYAEMDKIKQAQEDLGYAPEALTIDQINEIENNARGEIDAETRQLLDIYDEVNGRTNSLLQENFEDNQNAFADYRNQVLTNNAMQQQAIAGSTRYELDRQRRNAITRGASAAQRLVADINTQLGTQAKSAQQSLETSNVLAQQLLAHRQAQTSLRQDYMNNMNQQAMNRASLLKGSAERKSQYAQSQVGYNLDKNQYARDAWNNRVNDYFSGDSVGAGIYRSKYGTQRTNNGY